MKHTILHIILSVCLTGVGYAQQLKSDVVITGQIIGAIPNIVEFTVPVNGINYFGFEDAVSVDSTGGFRLSVNMDRPAIIELSKGYTSYGSIIAMPGATYEVAIDHRKEKPTIIVHGQDEAGQALYNQLPNRSMPIGDFDAGAAQYRQDSVATQIETGIKQRLKAELFRFDSLLEKNLISDDFYHLVKNDRTYFYYGVQGTVGFLNKLLSQRNQNVMDEASYIPLWSSIFEKEPVTHPELLRSPWFFYYTELFLRYQYLIVESTSFDTLTAAREQGAIHTHNIQTAINHLPEPQLEYYYAAYLYYNAINRNYEKELLTLFEQFKTTYPQSKYTAFIEPEIIHIIGFHEKKERSTNPEIRFLENPREMNSLAELAGQLEGKQFYVDVWATWCSPCKDEFRYNTELISLLRDKNIIPIYISIDKNDRAELWHDMVHYYELEGYHIHANDSLVDDLLQLRGDDPFTIPWHFLVDQAGTIVRKYVNGPSNIGKLAQELDGEADPD
ncbi:TlpA family protein disulfide reductase [Parapedobacter tibetensis]|uniref:TlpA family protein disulfide reductase n=1 Tax=Parapedobacter tibetensis TaxID=2972951 RepID=UPI00214D3DE8|nr:TlpA disulfide reductase family protein [Parapedobacter tibetensis]